MLQNKNESGQVLVSGLFFLVFGLLFCAYFLSTSEIFFHFFSNEEQANENCVKKTSYYANQLNEISINNINIISSIVLAQKALLKSLERSLDVAYHQPYWDKKITSGQKLSQNSKKIIESLFKTHSLTSARGFFIAKSLSERNKEIIHTFPYEIRKFFIQSTNTQVNCFAFEAEKKYYQSPGILNIHSFLKDFDFGFIKSYHYNMNLSLENSCAFKHGSKNILNYALLENYSNKNDTQYGISYVDPKDRAQFTHSLIFYSNQTIENPIKKFLFIRQFLSKIPYFKELNFNSENTLNKSPIQNKFKITHPNLSCHSIINDDCLISKNKFLKSFFKANWSVTGINKYEVRVPL